LEAIETNRDFWMSRNHPLQRAEILEKVCDLISQGRMSDANEMLISDYQPAVASTPRKPMLARRQFQLFLRDGFTDRYSGERLVYPGALLALSILLGPSFPYHPNWKQSVTHPAFWELYPTIDHIVPVARGGADDESNMVTTSMLRNSAKANWLLEELGWPAGRAPVVPDWDGLLGWFLSTCVLHEGLRQNKAIGRWRRAASQPR
jgi:5-methylcytosine-specific restriction endonuclease McrA